MSRTPILALAALAGALPLAAQALPRTVPERTGDARTSTTAEVGAFLDSLQMAGLPVTVTTMGTTAEGRPLYLVIASAPRVTSPAEARASGKLVVYLQANIHGGEVEGKEAVQVLLRELGGALRPLLDRLVILVAPVYNADGNDHFGPEARNRSEQNGPALVGERADGLNLDLNRDYFKAEAPETGASLARVFDTWDPALMMDLHTTDGTLHGFLLTYSPPLDPNGPPGPTAFVRDSLLPAVRATLAARYHEPVFDYGNVADPMHPTAWETYAPLGWYGTNYVGLRGRMSVLSEAYSHADFATRIRVTHDFVLEVLRYAAAHADAIRAIERDADRETALEGAGAVRRPDLAVDFKEASRGDEPVPLEVMRPNSDSGPGRPALLPTGQLRTVTLPIYDRFVGTKFRPLPAGYVLPAAEGGVARLLRLHGILVERLDTAWTDTVEVFGVSDLKRSPQQFQGHALVALTGEYARVVRTAPAGSYFVPTAQPLGRLVFSLLEPEGYGLARWGFFDRLLGTEAGAYAGLVFGSGTVGEYPVWRAVHEPRVPRRALP